MKILMSAYVDQNLGDDLFIDCLVTRYQDHEFYLLCNDDLELNPQLLRHGNLRKIGYKNAIKSVFMMDAMVMVGGSIFQDNPQYYIYDHMRNVLVMLYRAMGRKVFVVGSNVGPIRSVRGRMITQFCLLLANHISVRDDASYGLLRSWGFKKKLGCSPDVVFSYDYALPAVRPGPRFGLGISVINYARDPAKSVVYIDKLVSVVNEYLQRSASDAEVALFGFGGGREDDRSVVDTIFERCSNKTRVSRHVYDEKVPLPDYLARYLSCDYVICSRFHAFVLALKYGIPCFAIAYAEKTLNLLADIGFDRSYIEYSHMQDLDVGGLVKDALATTQGFQLPEGFVLKSEGHFLAMDRLLGAPRK